MKHSETTLCPVCGFDLGVSPWKDESPSDEICPSCGIHFGYDDYAAGNAEQRNEVYESWRKKWIQQGMLWWSSNPRPIGWNPAKQLAALKVKPD